MEQPTSIQLRDYIRLRWVAFAGQGFTVFLVHYALNIALPLFGLSTIIILGVLSNLIILTLQQNKRLTSSSLLAFLLMVDLLLLTALLYMSGGPYNPFSTLYVIHIAIASIALKRSLAWGSVLLSIACFALLFRWHVPVAELEHHGHSMDLHLNGMWVALGVTAAFMVYFVRKLHESILKLQRSMNRLEQSSILGTFAAAAAHELSTPLTTIQIITHDLIEQKINKTSSDLEHDVLSISKELDRCKAILSELNYSGGQPLGESFKEIDLREVIREISAPYANRIDIHLTLDFSPAAVEPLKIFGPSSTLKKALGGLVKNAFEAARSNVSITLGKEKTSHIHVTVSDDGEGLPPEVIRSLGEPFFTTKDKGMGLGVYIAKNLAEQLGGHLHWNSRRGKGAAFTFTLPANT